VDGDKPNSLKKKKEKVMDSQQGRSRKIEKRPSPPNTTPFNLEYAVEGIHALEHWILEHSELLPRRDYRVGLALLDDLKEHITFEPPM
jgi:hypothetical protein